MAKPQLENGYTKISNELLEALCRFRISGELRQIFDVIVRKTYGFNKSSDYISNSQIVEMTGLNKGNVSRGLSKLITNNLVIKTDNNGCKIISINKDYSTWKPLVIKTDNSHKKLSKVITGVIRSDNKKLSEVRDTKERKKLYKRNMQSSKKIATPKKIKKEKEKDEDMNLKQFVETMKTSPSRHIHIIADYAEEKKPRYNTKLQWREFTKRNVRTAVSLSKYTDEQIGEAFTLMKKDIRSDKNPKGFITKWGLETITKYLEEIK